jgi:hypothetical protein
MVGYHRRIRDGSAFLDRPDGPAASIPLRPKQVV